MFANRKSTKGPATRVGITHSALGVGLLMALQLAICAGAPQDTPNGRHGAEVNITVEDGMGVELHGAVLESFTEQLTGRDLAKQFRSHRLFELTATNIPYGHYMLRLRQAGFPEAERPVDISESEVMITVCVRTATVHLKIVSGFGHDLGEAKVESFQEMDDHVELAGRFSGNTATKIPYGIYFMRVDGPNITAVRRVDVFKPEVWAVFGQELYGPELPLRAPAWTVSGIVKNIDESEEPIFVRLEGVYVDFAIDDPVDVSGSSGTFSLDGTNPQGTFLLITTGRTGVLDVRRLDIPAKSPVVVDLASPSIPPAAIP